MQDNIIDLVGYRNQLQQASSSISEELATAIANLIQQLRDTGPQVA